MIERKCLHCGTWNGAEHFCKTCQAPLAPEEVEKSENAARAQELALRRPDQLDTLIEKARSSRFIVVRLLFYIVYSVAFVVFAIAAFAAYLIAWYPV